MTLVNAVYTPTGIVMSGDSRTSGPGYVQSDSTNKVFLLHKRIGILTAGNAHINFLPIEHFINQFEAENDIEEHSETVYEMAEKLGTYFKSVSKEVNVYLMIAGYDGNEPFLYELNTIQEPLNINRMNLNESKEVIYGIAWNGDGEVVNRLTSGQYMPQYNYMNLQDAIDYSRHLIRTTIDQLKFEPRFPTVGGEIDTLIIKPDGGEFIYKKMITYN
ncbi:hypothetical protein [Paenibacillus sp. FSL L8-0708]|uniref:hypothetical protein n=1 Tax=Paenibacillus sp. FSL L8-0708 TaxID=2975311 RepID=UPI0030F536B2